MTSIQDLWSLVIEELKKDVPHIALQTWFDDIEVLALNNRVLTLYTPIKFKRETIERYYTQRLQRVLRTILSETVEIQFCSEDTYRNYAHKRDSRPRSLRDSGEYTFERFVVGPSNQMAFAAARAVVAQRSRYSNPLIIQGASGLGKTHLLNAIACAVAQQDPDACVVYVKGDDFTNDLVDAIVHDRGTDFRKKYRNTDYFLMDDIQFIAGKKQTQEEFFNTFDKLYEANCQIVLAIDRPLYDLTTLQERIRNRFEGGLIVEVTAPDYETRCAIIKTKAAQRDLSLTEAEVSTIARRITCDIRKLEGVLNQLKAARAVPGCRPDEQALSLALQLYQPQSDAVPTPQELVDRVARLLHVDANLLLSRTNTKAVSQARQIVMYLLCQVHGQSTTQVGRFFGRDHSTVIHAVERVKERLTHDPEVQTIIGKLSE